MELTSATSYSILDCWMVLWGTYLPLIANCNVVKSLVVLIHVWQIGHYSQLLPVRYTRFKLLLKVILVVHSVIQSIVCSVLEVSRGHLSVEWLHTCEPYSLSYRYKLYWINQYWWQQFWYINIFWSWVTRRCCGRKYYCIRGYQFKISTRQCMWRG